MAAGCRASAAGSYLLHPGLAAGCASPKCCAWCVRPRGLPSSSRSAQHMHLHLHTSPAAHCCSLPTGCSADDCCVAAGCMSCVALQTAAGQNRGSRSNTLCSDCDQQVLASTAVMRMLCVPCLSSNNASTQAVQTRQLSVVSMYARPADAGPIGLELF